MLYRIITVIDQYTLKKLNILEIESPYLLHTIVSVILKEKQNKITFIDIKNNISYFDFNKEELINFLENFKIRNEEKTKELYKISVVNKIKKTNLKEYNQHSFSIELF